MTPRPSIVGRLAASRWFGDPRRRRAIVAVFVVLFALLSLYPQRYRAAATMTPGDGVGLGASPASANVFGNQAGVELALRVARSIAVRRAVAARLGLARGHGFADADAADRWLADTVDIRALRGGILQVEVVNRDAGFALALVRAFTDATRDRLAAIGAEQVAYRRQLASGLVERAAARLARAQTGYRGGAPADGVRAQLGEKEDELLAARALASDDAASRQLLAQGDALRLRLRETGADEGSGSPARHELAVASALYDGYRRILENTASDELTTSRGITLVEPPYVDSARQFDVLHAAIGLLVLLLGLAVEAYQLNPPRRGRS